MAVKITRNGDSREFPDFWRGLKERITSASRQSLALAAVVTFVFPVLEGILVNKWTDASIGSSAAIGWSLLVIAALHTVLGALLLLEQAATPHLLLAQAVELTDQLERSTKELARREITYRLVRTAFDGLSLQTCSVHFGQPADAWCHGGFHSCLEPILKPLLDKVDDLFGVSTMQFTLEAYFEPGRVPVHGRECRGPNGLCQHFFHGYVDHCDGVCMEGKCSPAKLGFDADDAFEQHIENNRQLFFSGTQVKSKVYFRSFAVCPIYEPCSDERIGVLVLTSMQDEPFADDVLDTMAFVATLISQFLSAYDRCYLEQQSTAI